MLEYAQTNIQLFNQMLRAGYATRDLERLHQAYELVMHLFAGRFRGSGKTFIAHLIGTASVLAAMRAPADVVVGGLLHAAYEQGDFGDGRNGATHARQNRLRQTIGAEAEEYVARYTAQPWDEMAIASLRDQFDQLDLVDRNLLLIRLANELDDHIDLNGLYCGNAEQRRKYVERCGAMQVKLAERLSLPKLAADLAHVFNETVTAEIPAQLRRASAFSFTVAPKSHEKRLRVALRRQVAGIWHRLRSRKSDQNRV